METKENPNVDKNKKGNGMSKEAAAAAAGLAGMAGVMAGGLAGGSFGSDEEEKPTPTPPKPEPNPDILTDETTQQETENIAQVVVDPDEVPFSDPEYQPSGQQQPIQPEQDPIAEVDVDEIVDEIISIEEVDEPLVADVVDFEDYGVIYTEDGEEVPADVLVMESEGPDMGEQSLAEAQMPEFGETDPGIGEDQLHGADTPEDNFDSFDPMIDVIS